MSSWQSCRSIFDSPPAPAPAAWEETERYNIEEHSQSLEAAGHVCTPAPVRTSVRTAVRRGKRLGWIGWIVWSCTLTPCLSSSRAGLSCCCAAEGSGIAPGPHSAPQHPSLQWTGLIRSSLSQRSKLRGFGLDPPAPVVSSEIGLQLCLPQSWWAACAWVCLCASRSHPAAPLDQESQALACMMSMQQCPECCQPL